MALEVKLPDLGDGIESGDILEILVAEGDQVRKEQGIIELETDKATVEVPTPAAGIVAKIHVSTGDTVSVGALLVTIDTADAATSTAPGGPAPKTESAPAPAAPVEPEPASEQPATPAAPTPAAPTPAASTPAASTPPTPTTPAEPTPAAVTPAPVTPAPAPSRASAPPLGVESSHDVPAGPAVRRFAREVGVDLSRVTGSGADGRITREDVLAVVRNASKSGGAAIVEGASERDKWGPVHIEKMPRIRKAIAKNMHHSWSTIPRVTNFDDADVTDLENIRQKSKADYASAGIKLTTMPFVIKSVAMALKTNPAINASVDMEAGQIIYKDYINVGIAVDTDRGLVVPSLRDADSLSVSAIARSLDELATAARDNKFGLEDLQGSTFTISNLGAIGGTYSTPIINSPEVAILLVGRARKMPIIVDDEVVARLMMPLSLSYDHRQVDGGAAARFLNDVIGFLQAPSRLLLAP